MTCSFCKNWVAGSRAQYKHRMEVLRAYPETAAHPCPTCGTTDWATIPPDGVDALQVKLEVDNERQDRLRLEEKRAKGHWLLFWRRWRSP